MARVNNRTLRTVDDYCDVARQYLRRMHDENVVEVEVAVSPQGFTRRGLEIKRCIEALASAFREALDNFGMTGGIIAGCRRRPDEFYVFDGLYGRDPSTGDPMRGIETVDQWLAQRMRQEPVRPGALRVVYIEQQTGPFSRKVGELIAKHLAAFDAADAARLSRCYRVEPFCGAARAHRRMLRAGFARRR